MRNSENSAAAELTSLLPAVTIYRVPFCTASGGLCKEVSTNNRCRFAAIFLVFPGFCLKKLQQLFSDNS